MFNERIARPCANNVEKIARSSKATILGTKLPKFLGGKNSISILVF